jgi:extradiol dioxygenase family protein
MKNLTMKMPPFHLAFPVTDLERTREFYGKLLGCQIGRSAERWVDLDFFGHQLSAHLVDGAMPERPTNTVDGKEVPVQHFGAILEMGAWEQLAARLAEAQVEFIIKPYIRFKGEVGEQGTMFLLDPSGNALEFKAFADASKIFAT